METLLRDLRHAFRSLIKRPAFTTVALITIALGIGGTSAMFTVVNAVLLRPLPYPQADHIVQFVGINPSKGIDDSNMSIPDFADWKNQSQNFEHLALFATGGVFLTTNDETVRVRGAFASEDFFPLFRTNALLGRTLQVGDAQNANEPVVVLSHALWQRQFGGNPNIVNTKLNVHGETSTIVGVMPDGFDYPDKSEIWGLLPVEPAKERRDNRFVNVIGRLKSGTTIAAAQEDLDTVNQRLAQAYPETNTGWSTRVVNLQELIVGDLRVALIVLLGAVAFVLLIGCANVANLLLARATARQREMAVRSALGASRARLVRQLLTESALLSFIGGGIGLLLSVWLTKLLIAISPTNTPRVEEIRPDGLIIGFTLVLAIITGLVFGLAPALQASRLNLMEGLRDGLRSSTRNRIRSALMVTEIAFSFVLLVGAGLLIKSFSRLRDVSPGFNASNVLAVRLSLPPGKYAQGEPRAQIFHQITEKLKAIPGVQSAGAVLSLPLGGDTFNVGRSYIREGQPATPEESSTAAYLPITPDYFQTLHIPVVAGRSFNDRDTNTTTKVVIVSESLARKAWPGESPIGRRITIWRDEKFPREIVGVVGDIKESLDEQFRPQMYVPYAQDAIWGSLSFVLRTNRDPSAIGSAVRNEVRSIDKGIPIVMMRTMDDVYTDSVSGRRAPMLLLSSFAAVALLLATIGIYGVTAYYVSQRTQEIGIRMALGARATDVLGLVLKSGMGLAFAGIVLGLVGSLFLTRLMTALLFDVKPNDVWTLIAVAACLLLTALLACLVPARRATKVDPLVALRYE